MDMFTSRRMPLGIACRGLRNGLMLCLALSFPAGSVQARDYQIKLRLLDGRTGAPIPNKEVTLALGYDPPSPRGKTQEIARATTAADGVATFALSDPLPGNLGLRIYDLRDCVSASTFNLPIMAEEVIRQGVVLENTCDKSAKLKGKIVAKPGELVIFMEPISWWRRLIPIK